MGHVVGFLCEFCFWVTWSRWSHCSFSKILFLSHRDTLVTLVTLYFFSPRTRTLIIWVTGSQIWVTFVTRVTAKTLVTLVHGHRVTLVTLVTLCFFSTNAFSRVTRTRHTRRSHLALFCPIMSHIYGSKLIVTMVMERWKEEVKHVLIVNIVEK